MRRGSPDLAGVQCPGRAGQGASQFREVVPLHGRVCDGAVESSLAERDLVISAGKMSGLWSGDPASIKLSDLDIICAVLGCGVEELLIPEPGKVSSGKEQESQAAVASASAGPPKVTPRRRDGRSLPPA